MKIGIAGTGRMGAAVALRLIDLKHEVSVWNRSTEKTVPLADAGAKIALSPSQLASQSEIVVSFLSDANAVQETYVGEGGLLSGDVRGKLFIEMSTVRPEVQQKLSGFVREKGAAHIECPVGGTVGPARDGKLFGFVGGEATDVSRAMPILEKLCRRVEYVGPIGSGAYMKLAINLPLLVYWQALGEALVLMKPLGLDPKRVVDILADTSGGPNMLKVRGAAIAKGLSGEEITPITFDVDLIRKDLRTMIEEARSMGCGLPLTERALECFDEAARDGIGGKDAVALPVHFLANAKSNL